MKEKTQMLRILEILDREGPLSNKKIAEKGNLPDGTVRCYTSLLTRSGVLKRYKDIKGVFEITQKGRKALMEAKDEG